MSGKLLFTLAATVIFCVWQNNSVVVTEHEYVNKKLPRKFHGCKILHISDFHNKKYYADLTDKIRKIKPDIIVITGDLLDRRRTRIDVASDFAKEIVKVSPVYYVSGNHEQLSVHYGELRNELQSLNVINMDNSYTVLKKEGEGIGIMGVADPAINWDGKDCLIKNDIYMRNNINELMKKSDTDFNILLSHRPEHMSVYKELNIDLVFSGHSHGGQIRIPFLGGILSPNQGFFPKYSEGMHIEGATAMVVSRGLGNSLFPLRIFNRPELVTVVLKQA